MPEQDSLVYGVVVARLDDGNWWHGHMVRSDLEYPSDLLGRRTTLLFLMVRYGPWAIRKSPDFYLTLDGEGVPEELCPVRFDGDWGERTDDGQLKEEAAHIQVYILPQLFDSDRFQAAMASVVHNQMYKKTADVSLVSRVLGNL